MVATEKRIVLSPYLIIKRGVFRFDLRHLLGKKLSYLDDQKVSQLA